MLSLLTYLALKIDQNGTTVQIEAPEEIPTGGLGGNGMGVTIIQNSIQLLIGTIIILSLFFIIYGGVKWITSSGDKTKLDSARKTIMYAIIGLILAFLSFMIVTFIGKLFGLDLLNRSFN